MTRRAEIDGTHPEHQIVCTALPLFEQVMQSCRDGCDRHAAQHGDELPVVPAPARMA